MNFHIPGTSKVDVFPDYDLGECVYEIFDQSGKIIWKGFIKMDASTGDLQHKVDSFAPDNMIVRQLSYLGDNVEASFVRELKKRQDDSLMAFCDVVISTSPLSESAPVSLL